MTPESRHLLSHLPPDTAESVLGWLASRGRHLPVHISLKTIRFARECFSLIDVDSSGTLEREDLRAVFKALGQDRVSLRQVARLVESVAGPGASHLRFGDFAQMMHGAMSSRRREELELQSRMQQDAHQQRPGSNRGSGGGGEDRGARGAGGGAGGEAEPPLNRGDFHLLAKAFRRRVILVGVTRNAAGWRERVMALAQRQAASSRGATTSAGSAWKHSTQRLQQRQEATGAAAGPAGADAGGPTDAGGSGADGGGCGRDDLLGGAVSAGPTTRGGACGGGHPG